MSSLFKRLLQERDTGHFFNAIRRYRLKEEEFKVENYVWDQSVHPSSMHFDMCLQHYFDNEVDHREPWRIDNLYKACAGTAKHKELQDEALKIADLLYAKPTNLSPEMAEKLETIWPEVPVKYAPAGMSMRIDAVLSVKGLPLPIDIKSTSVEPKQWEEKMEKAREYYQGKFTDIPVKPDTISYRKYYTQMCLYIFGLNESGYYPDKITQGGFAYVNMLMPPGSKGSEVEIYFPYMAEIEELTKYFVDHVILHRNAKLAGESLPCTYKYCHRHRKQQLEVEAVKAG